MNHDKQVLRCAQDDNIGRPEEAQCPKDLLRPVQR